MDSLNYIEVTELEEYVTEEGRGSRDTGRSVQKKRVVKRETGDCIRGGGCLHKLS